MRSVFLDPFELTQTHGSGTSRVMTRLAKHLNILTIATFVLSSACGSTDPESVNPEDYCGANTTYNKDTGKCDGVEGETTECAEGTKKVENECVPDGSVICPDGTEFNTMTGQCDPTLECGEGTTKVGDECVPNDSTLMGMADLPEPPEPNDTSGGNFSLPELNSEFYIYGCISPTEDLDEDGALDPDFDRYTFSTGAASLIRVKVDGINGLVGGFVIQGADADATALMKSNWIRFGLSMTSDTAERQVFLPSGGTYNLDISDSRAILSAGISSSTNTGAGGINACYFVTITTEAMPTAQPLVDYTATGTLGLDVYSMTNVVDDALWIAKVTDGSSQTAQGGVSIVESPTNAFLGANGYTGMDADTITSAVNIDTGKDLLLVVDPVISYGINPVDYTLTVENIGFGLPGDGSTVSVKNPADWVELGIFDVENDHTVVRIEASHTGPAGTLYIVDANLQTLHIACDQFSPCNSIDKKLYFDKAGTYMLFINPGGETPDSDEDGIPDYEVTSTLTHSEVTELTPGMDSADTSLATPAYFRTTVSDWVLFGFTPSNFAGDTKVDIWNGIVPAAGTIPERENGALGAELALVDSLSGDAGRIYYDYAEKIIVQVQDGAETPSDTASVVVNTQDRMIQTVELSAASTTAELMLTSSAEGSYVLIKAGPEYSITVTATGTDAAMTIETLDRTEAVLDTVVASEGVATMSADLGLTEKYIALRITDADEDPTMGSAIVNITAVAPVNYTVVGMPMTPVADVCTNGATVTTNDDGLGYGALDEGLSGALALGEFAFKFYGFDVSNIYISTNGFLSFSPLVRAMWFNYPIPVADDPNNLISPYWDDFKDVAVCYFHDTTNNSFVIEWKGTAWSPPNPTIHTQVVLHGDDYTIDTIIVKEGTTMNGSSGTSGVENASGTRGAVWFNNAVQDFSVNNGAKYTPEGGE